MFQVDTFQSVLFKTLKCSQLREVLTEYGYNYTNESIMSSELRVLKYLNYRLGLPSLYSMTDILVQSLVSLVPSADMELVRSITDQVLELFHYHHDELYEKLFEKLKGHRRDPTSQR